jgi:DNA polymerase V
VGVSTTKTLAKLANKLAKKRADGVCILGSDAERNAALAVTKVGDIWGIGRASARKLHAAGIQTAKQLCEAEDRWLLKQLTIVGLKLVHELRGESCLNLELMRERKKTMCVSRSFGRMIDNVEELKQSVALYAARLGEKLRSQASLAKMLHVFFHTNSFRDSDPQIHRAGVIELPVPTSATNQLTHAALLAVEKLYRPGFRFKKAGIIALEVTNAGQRQQNLFNRPDSARDGRVSAVMDRINHAFGRHSIKLAAEGISPQWATKFEKRSPRYTTRWDELPVAYAR